MHMYMCVRSERDGRVLAQQLAVAIGVAATSTWLGLAQSLLFCLFQACSQLPHRRRDQRHMRARVAGCPLALLELARTHRIGIAAAPGGGRGGPAKGAAVGRDGHLPTGHGIE